MRNETMSLVLGNETLAIKQMDYCRNFSTKWRNQCSVLHSNNKVASNSALLLPCIPLWADLHQVYSPQPYNNVEATHLLHIVTCPPSASWSVSTQLIKNIFCCTPRFWIESVSDSESWQWSRSAPPPNQKSGHRGRARLQRLESTNELSHLIFCLFLWIRLW